MRIVIADDQEMLRHLLHSVLRDKFPKLTIYEVANYNDLSLFLSENDVRLVVLDLRMPGYNGLTSIKELVKRYPKTKIVICSAIDNMVVAKTLYLFGIYAYHSKTGCLNRLIQDIESIVSDFAENQHEDFVLEGAHFTERQCEVIELLYQGVPNKIISRKLGISESTIKFHIKEIFKMTGVKSRSELNFMLYNCPTV